MRSEWPWALVVAMFAGVLDLGQLHNLQTSDSLVPSLVSLQAWTPFFWQQDRYGMLIPLVFTFIAHPLYNQLAITWASFFAGLCSVMAVAHLFFCASRAWRLVGFVSIAMLVGITPAPIVFDVLGPGQFFTMPLAMGLGARCLFVESAGVVRRCLGFLMLCAAAWINCVSPIWLCLLCAAKQLGDVRQNAPKHGRRPIVCNGFYLALLVAFGAGLVAMRAAPVQDVRLTDVATPWVMLKTCACLAQTYARLYAASPTMIVGSAMLVGMAASNAYWRGSVAAFGRGAQQACGASASYMLLCASQRWVVQGKYHYRFWLPAALVLGVACVGAGTGPWLHRLSEAWQRRLASAVCAAMLCSAVLRFGVPSIAGVARSYRALGGSTSIEANTLRCTHVAGSYWRVWPTVFAANIKRYEMGFEPPLLGVTDRAQQTIHLWPDDALSWRICVPPGDAVAMAYVQGIEHIQFVRVKRGAHLDVLSAKSSTVTP